MTRTPAPKLAAKHTPGPWRLLDRSDGATGYRLEDAVDERLIAYLDNSMYVDERYDCEQEANCALIASAPDLLDGCNALLGLLQLLSRRDDISDEAREFLTKGHRIDEAEAAVAKATGGEA